MSVKAYFLVGPTSSGKSEVAHLLARRMSLPILSIDSMQVYRGLDIGTAKPAPSEIKGITYYGLDVVDPDKEFSVAHFCRYVRGVVGEINTPLIVCGGTGLYSKALTDGLDDGPRPDPELRAEWRAAADAGNVGLLRAELKKVAPEVLDAMDDAENPRRVMRALEWAKAGRVPSRTWTGKGAVFTGLNVAAGELRVKIELRAEKMFKAGIIDETRAALEKFGMLSRTASQAIGYAEALEVLGGRMTCAAALESVKARTRRLAKRQRTWFRNQSQMDWISVEPGADAEALADLVGESWRRNGAVSLFMREDE